jgi:peptide/nickel transport system substrate-binding protein
VAAGLAAILAVTASACGGGGGGATPAGGSESTPRYGGTLRMMGSSDTDALDPMASYSTWGSLLLRLISRQLVSYRASTDPAVRDTPVPDLVESIPQPTEGGTVYTFRLRPDAMWDTDPPRPVTAADAVRGFKRMCNPTHKAAGAIGYFATTIVGLEEYCTGFLKVEPEVEPMRRYIQTHEIPGVRALDDRTLQIRLLRPTTDFLNILAMTFSTPAPVEYLDYLPDSPEMRRNFISDGPYKIAEYKPDQRYVLVRNPVWKPESDPLRKAYVERVEITIGPANDQTIKQIQAGTVDMGFNARVPTPTMRQMLAARDPQLKINASGYTNPYIIMNLQSPNNNGALKDVRVRRALNYAVDKQAVVQQLGGPKLVQPLDQILTPQITVGYRKFNLYSTPDHRGDPVKARQLLEEAGYRDLTLKAIYRSGGRDQAVWTTIQQDFAKAGVRLEVQPVPADQFYVKYLQNKDGTKRGEWDLASAGWNPDWQGNAARTFFVPLLDGRYLPPASSNYAHYNNPKVGALIDKALSARTAEEATDIWAEADRLVMQDAPWIPLISGSSPNYVGTRVRNWIYMPGFDDGDPANVWLSW